MAKDERLPNSTVGLLAKMVEGSMAAEFLAETKGRCQTSYVMKEAGAALRLRDL